MFMFVVFRINQRKPIIMRKQTEKQQSHTHKPVCVAQNVIAGSASMDFFSGSTNG